MPVSFSRFSNIIAAIVFALLVASAAAVACATDAVTRKPNVLFLFADDQRADTIAALGNPAIKTPTLDELARSGFVFRNAYCLGSNQGAVCTPSRNMLLSGRTYFRWKGPLASADEPNLPASMNAAGYSTYHHGKRGNSALNIQAKFEINKYLKNDDDERRSGEPGREIVDDAIAFLNSRSDDRPFCMYLAFGNPHDPRVAAQKYLDQYERDKIPLPKNFLPRHPFDNGELQVRDEKLAPWPRTEEDIRRHLHEYYAVITALDGHIGRLIATLKQLDQFENTIVVYSADHGLAMGSHGLMGKQNLYEHSMKAPLIFAGPGIPRGASEALVYLLDIFPTLCDLASTEIPIGLDGKSLKAVITGQSRGMRDSLGLAYRDVQRVIRDERWKLLRYPHVDKTQLFDLRADPDEMHDLSADPAQQPRIEQLLAELRKWQADVGDTAPL